MIRKLLEDHIRKNVTDDKVAVLLSGGVDSISVGLAAHHAGKEVHAYSFQLGNQTSYDFAKAAEVAYKMKWEFTPVVVPKENLIPDDWNRLVELGCRKKTHFETVFPFLYVYPEIEETYVVTGWGADGYFGVSKKAMMRYSSMKKGRNYVAYCKKYNQKRLTFNQFREAYFAEGQCAGLDWHNKLIPADKKHITPYLDEKVRDYLMSKTYRELNTPKQKSIVRRDFTEFKKFGRIETHINLHLAAGVDKLFETLLNNPEINFKDRKRMIDVCRDWYKKETTGVLPI
jgi:asparagine synthetase B (glutamine-hydrolysing)